MWREESREQSIRWVRSHVHTGLGPGVAIGRGHADKSVQVHGLQNSNMPGKSIGSSIAIPDTLLKCHADRSIKGVIERCSIQAVLSSLAPHQDRSNPYMVSILSF